ncbi:hypothetical protein OESDEN_03255 [Oesophagostomum dentatum]|uniref:Uncharacterized protein n=1 Tax=Oesophagostomum dentatum TaxID=61180 RepID=A0A0B1THP9_OESDE|nr:hypothetical protein OESDEN_03255 [Oesophagostomum dentatum]
MHNTCQRCTSSGWSWFLLRLSNMYQVFRNEVGLFGCYSTQLDSIISQVLTDGCSIPVM